MKSFVCIFLFLYSIYNYFNFFSWYLGPNQKIIEEALHLSLLASIPLFIMIIITHIYFYPKNVDDHAQVISFPPIIMLFSVNLAFFVGSLNRYYFQIYDLPEFLDILRDPVIGVILIILAFLIIISAIKEFKNINEDPMPTTSSQNLIRNKIYKWTRNPMYLGILIFQVGLGMSLSYIHITLFSLFTFIIFHYLVVKREEIYLEKQFKEKYLLYKKEVRRWL
ncbi:MAG: hypothetical protein CMD88_05095 [Gammaproteobacteria bacterium]|nr:hypothetical protein [Gammaproteobacteria bacterium]|tara:strand:- start:82 stop:747 length:666 start_codon:yes stop_codon:yes gene_type:complete